MGLAIIAEKINFKAKNIPKMKDFIIIKGSISYNTTILVDMCVCVCARITQMLRSTARRP